MEQNRTLHLSLKKEWFDMIIFRVKKEEYREGKLYWMDRLTKLIDFRRVHNQYDFIEFTLGYPAKGDTDRRAIFKCEGITYDYGNPEWGAPYTRKVFIIKIGERIAFCHTCGQSTPYENVCEICGEHYCDECSAVYDQFNQIDYNCCSGCASRERD